MCTENKVCRQENCAKFQQVRALAKRVSDYWYLPNREHIVIEALQKVNARSKEAVSGQKTPSQSSPGAT